MKRLNTLLTGGILLGLAALLLVGVLLLFGVPPASPETLTEQIDTAESTLAAADSPLVLATLGGGLGVAIGVAAGVRLAMREVVS